MSAFQTVAIPFRTYGNRQYLTALQLLQEPWLQDFVDQFPNCFERDPCRDILIYWPDGDAPVREASR